LKLKYKVPLLNSGQVNLQSFLQKFSVLKPHRRLGGGWMADRAACRRNLTLCARCVRKYGNWYDALNYIPDWDYSPAYQRPGFASKCDGCAQVDPLEGLTGFFPAETAYEIMSKDFHFRKPNPRRLIFSR